MEKSDFSEKLAIFWNSKIYVKGPFVTFEFWEFFVKNVSFAELDYNYLTKIR